MPYLLVALFVPIFLFAEFKQERRFIRIARNENVSYGDLLSEMLDDKPTLIGTILLTSCFPAVAALVAMGFRMPEDAIPFAALALPFFVGLILKTVGFRRLLRDRRD